MVTPVPFSGTDFTGATASAAGTHGYVPAPAAGDQNKVLKGGGAWATIPETANEMPMSSSDSTTVKAAIDGISNVVTEIPLTITPASWSSTSPYTYTWTDSRVLSDSSVEVDILNTSADTAVDYIDYAKSSGGGGIVFTANNAPTANINVVITITNAQAHAGSSIDADTVATDVISGASNVDEALTTLNNKMPKCGYKNITIPAGGAQVETVLFDTAFPSGTTYAVLITQADQYAYADLFFGSTDRTVSGFKINGSSSRSASITIQVMWAAIPI